MPTLIPRLFLGKRKWAWEWGYLTPLPYQQVRSPITAHTSASAYATGSFHSQAPLILQYCSTCASNQTQNERAALETGFRFLSFHLLCSALDSSTPSTPKYPSSQRLLQTFTKQHYLLLSMLHHHVYVHDCVIYDIHYLWVLQIDNIVCVCH